MMDKFPPLRILNRELKALFFSPIAYIILSIFLVTTGWFFFSPYFLVDRVSMRDFFNLLPIIFAFTIPALTMRLFSEEYRSGSYEILMTLPISHWEVVIGKFLAAFMMVLVMLAPTLVYVVFVALTGDLDLGPVVGGYVGAAFLAATFCGIGLYSSSLTNNQVLAFILSVSICFFLVIVENILFFVPSFLTPLLQYLGAAYHFENIAKGVIDSRDLVYFISMTYVSLHLTSLVHREKK